MEQTVLVSVFTLKRVAPEHGLLGTGSTDAEFARTFCLGSWHSRWESQIVVLNVVPQPPDLSATSILKRERDFLKFQIHSPLRFYSRVTLCSQLFKVINVKN